MASPTFIQMTWIMRENQLNHFEEFIFFEAMIESSAVNIYSHIGSKKNHEKQIL